MKDVDSYIPLVEQSRNGDAEALERLIEQVRGPLVEYLCRLTAHEEEAQDLAQECLLDMVKVIGQLRESERFWPWMRRIAYNKACDRRQESKRSPSRSLNEIKKELETQMIDSSTHRGLANLISKELSDAVWNAMQSLKPEHRQVLVLRCYEEMDFTEIGRMMNRRSFTVRMMFTRAKRQLQRLLSRRGYGKEMLLVALVLYGKMTAQSTASAATVTISATSLKTGFVAAVLAAVFSKVGLLITAVGLAAGGWTSVQLSRQVAARSDIPKTVQTPVDLSNEPTAEAAESWFYYPEGHPGPVMIRFLVGDRSQDRTCRTLQNDSRNYLFEPPNLYITNYRHWRQDNLVQLLPTDSVELTKFIEATEGRQRSWRPGSHSNIDNLWIVFRNPEEKSGFQSKAGYHPDALREMYFRSDWGTNVVIHDQRDQLHKQGWCSFRLEGQVNGIPVSGRGRIPFVYAMLKTCPPWIQVSVGDRVMTDRFDLATRFDRKAGTLESFSAGSFFQGLSRPWMGLHAIDTVRRDAAEQKVPFETRIVPDGTTAEVTATVSRSQGDLRIRYSIDMESDSIQKIRFETPGNSQAGEIRFTYFGTPIEPETLSGAKPVPLSDHPETLGIDWLIDMTAAP
jgi:RNA polymerase sigma factor (sigma-70 family)